MQITHQSWEGGFRLGSLLIAESQKRVPISTQRKQGKGDEKNYIICEGKPEYMVLIFCRHFVVAWIAIWLILPVVIRLSQRLSHACLSINESIL